MKCSTCGKELAEVIPVSTKQDYQAVFDAIPERQKKQLLEGSFSTVDESTQAELEARNLD